MALLHDHNTIPRFASDALVSDVVSALRQDGVAVIERAITLSAHKVFERQMADWFDASPLGEGVFFGRLTRRFSAVFAKAPAACDLALHALVLPVMEQLLRGDDAQNPRCDEIELSATQAIGIGPGEGAQFLHRDDGLWPFPHDYEIMANAMWMVDDFTTANGGTRVIPGSHLWPLDRNPSQGDAVPVNAPAGSVLLWTGRVLHGGGANTTPKVRRGLVLSYKLGWLASQEKLLLSHSPDLVRTFPARLQRLLGYQLHRPNLGWVEGRDPLEWLRGEVGPVAATRDNLTDAHQAILADAKNNPEAYAGYVL